MEVLPHIVGAEWIRQSALANKVLPPSASPGSKGKGARAKNYRIKDKDWFRAGNVDSIAAALKRRDQGIAAGAAGVRGRKGAQARLFEGCAMYVHNPGKGEKKASEKAAVVVELLEKAGATIVPKMSNVLRLVGKATKGGKGGKKRKARDDDDDDNGEDDGEDGDSDESESAAGDWAPRDGRVAIIVNKDTFGKLRKQGKLKDLGGTKVDAMIDADRIRRFDEDLILNGVMTYKVDFDSNQVY